MCWRSSRIQNHSPWTKTFPALLINKPLHSRFQEHPDCESPHVIRVNYSLIRQALSIQPNILNLSTPPKQSNKQWSYHESVMKERFSHQRVIAILWIFPPIWSDIGVFLPPPSKRSHDFPLSRVERSANNLSWKMSGNCQVNPRSPALEDCG